MPLNSKIGCFVEHIMLCDWLFWHMFVSYFKLYKMKGISYNRVLIVYLTDPV